MGGYFEPPHPAAGKSSATLPEPQGRRKNMEQLFIAVGECADHACTYIYAFTDPDAAIDFVSLAKQHDDDAVTHWDILTERPRTALEAYAAHRAWVEE